MNIPPYKKTNYTEKTSMLRKALDGRFPATSFCAQGSFWDGGACGHARSHLESEKEPCKHGNPPH